MDDVQIHVLLTLIKYREVQRVRLLTDDLQLRQRLLLVEVYRKALDQLVFLKRYHLNLLVVLRNTLLERKRRHEVLVHLVIEVPIDVIWLWIYLWFFINKNDLYK